MRNYAITIAFIVISAGVVFCKGREVKGLQKWATFPEPENVKGIYPEGTSEMDIFADKMEGLISMLPYPAREWKEGIEDIAFLTIKIDKNGRPSGMISKDTLNAFDSTALKLLDLMPKKMIPAIADDGKPIGIVFMQPIVFRKGGKVMPEVKHQAVFEGGEKYIGKEKELEKYNTETIIKYLRKNIKYRNSVQEMAKNDGIVVKMTVGADGKANCYMVKKCRFPALNDAIMTALNAYDGNIEPAQYVTGEKTESTIYLHINPVGRQNPEKNPILHYRREFYSFEKMNAGPHPRVEKDNSVLIPSVPSTTPPAVPQAQHYNIKM